VPTIFELLDPAGGQLRNILADEQNIPLSIPIAEELDGPACARILTLLEYPTDPRAGMTFASGREFRARVRGALHTLRTSEDAQARAGNHLGDYIRILRVLHVMSDCAMFRGLWIGWR
jgi:hypothetical protein